MFLMMPTFPETNLYRNQLKIPSADKAVILD